MTPEQMARLRELAGMASPGPWQYAEDYPVVIMAVLGGPIVCRMIPDAVEEPGSDDVANGRYIAAANPQAVLALLDAVSTIQQEKAALEGGWDAETVKRQVADFNALGDAVRTWRVRAEQAEQERDQLTTWLAEWQGHTNDARERAEQAERDRAQAIEIANVANRERDAWQMTAEQHCRNEAFYRDIVQQTGAHFGPAAYTSDDGSVQDSVLALKVPELAAQAVRRANNHESQWRYVAMGVAALTGVDCGEPSDVVECVRGLLADAELFREKAKQVEATTRRLRVALDWYASDEAYAKSSIGDDARVLYDHGRRARAALTETDEDYPQCDQS